MLADQYDDERKEIRKNSTLYYTNPNNRLGVDVSCEKRFISSVIILVCSSTTMKCQNTQSCFPLCVMMVILTQLCVWHCPVHAFVTSPRRTCRWVTVDTTTTTTTRYMTTTDATPSTVSTTPTTNNNNNNDDISEAAVLQAARTFMKATGYFDPLNASLLADDFVFRGPVIGPLNKDDYQEVLEYFGMYKAFPDMENNCFGFTIDPENPLRVWFFLRATGTYQHPLGGPVGRILRPQNQSYRGSTEAWSLTFTQDLKVQFINAGYVADRFDANATTGGAGLSFGILQSLGLSLPSAAGDPRLRIIQGMASFLQFTGLLPKAVSRPDQVPAWWTNEKRGADP